MARSATSLRERLTLGVAPPLAAAWLRLVRLTTRIRREGAETALPEDGGPVIYVFWHRQLAMMPWVQLRPPTVVPISRSRDGEITARLFSYLQVEAVRGSSSRGGAAAARAMLQVARAGRDMAITPDGPRGPAEIVQPGATWLARVAGRPLLPVAYATNRYATLRTWDRMLLPLPFGRGVFVYGEHLRVDADADAEGLAAADAELERRLRKVSERAGTLLLT